MGQIRGDAPTYVELVDELERLSDAAQKAAWNSKAVDCDDVDGLMTAVEQARAVAARAKHVADLERKVNAEAQSLESVMDQLSPAVTKPMPRPPKNTSQASQLAVYLMLASCATEGALRVALASVSGALMVGHLVLQQWRDWRYERWLSGEGHEL